MPRAPTPIDIEIGARIRRARQSRQLSLDALRVAIGVTHQQMHKYESGRNRVAASTLVEIASPFKVGDLITPRQNSSVKGVGDPHLVVEMCEPFDRVGDSPRGALYGEISDLKVACIMHGHDCLFYGWSGDYGPYTGDGA